MAEHLVGAGEVRDRLGRPSRQRVYQITTDPSLPKPYDELQMGKVWRIAIQEYGVCMAVKKVTVTLPEELVKALGSAAREDGVPLSRLVASAAESELRRRVGRKVVSDWQAEHGAFTLEELAAARAEMAAADAEVFDVSGPAAA